MKNTIIRCKSEEEYKAVLKKLEDKGCTWLSGHKPTEKTEYYNYGFDLLFVSNDIITTGSSDHVFFDKNNYKNHEYTTADDFIGNKPIVIYRVGRNVVAYDQDTGKNAIAKCHPDDEFDFYIGAKLAFSRLIGCDFVDASNTTGCDTKETTNSTNFKIGDTVNVKSGLVVGRRYHGQYGTLLFHDAMNTDKPLTIDFISTTGNFRCNNGYYYTPNMLEKCNEVDCSKFNVGDKVALKLNLVVGNEYNDLHLTKNMACFGDTLTITKIVHYNNSTTNYACDNGYTYSEDMLEHIDDAIVIGSKIEVVDNGVCYDTYWQWVDKNVKEQNDKIRYAFHYIPDVNDVGRVIAIAPHLHDKRRVLIYFKGLDDTCYLIESEGVKKCDEQN